MASFKKKVNVSRIVLIASIPVILVALVLAGFFSFRRTLARFSLDFYYPFYQAAKKVELAAAEQALATRSRQELAIAVGQLQRENAMLAARVRELNELKVENENLRQIRRLEAKNEDFWRSGILPGPENAGDDENPRSWILPGREKFTHVYSEVILRDPVTWNEQFVIDKGKNDGIETGCLVLSFQYGPSGKEARSVVVVGRVIEVSKHASVVATVVNPECRLSVSVGLTAHGTLVGNGASSMTALISHLPLKQDRDDRASYSGEKVETSGYSGYAPEGILIGNLIAPPRGVNRTAVVHESGLYAEAWMMPAISLDMIRFVVVLVPKTSGPEQEAGFEPDSGKSA